MTNRWQWNNGVWVSTTACVFIFLYLISPLAQYNLVWMMFIAVPIYFTAGAKPEDFLSFLACSAMGVLWGMFILEVIAVMAGWGMSDAASCAVGSGVCTVACCLHNMVPRKYLLCNVPMMFGSISAVFSQGGAYPGIIVATMWFGLALGLVAGCAGRFLTPEGKWTFLAGKASKN